VLPPDVNFHPKPQMKPITIGKAFQGVPDDGTGNRVGSHTKIWRNMQDVKPGETHHKHFSHYRLDFHTPGRTLQKALGMSHYHVWHPVEHRVITLAECKRIASFPDAFQFAGKVSEAWDRIGNSVPPRFMEAVASHIYETLLLPSSQKDENV
jgi:DNA (cytosine-5)-methyltransferase 1